MEFNNKLNYKINKLIEEGNIEEALKLSEDMYKYEQSMYIKLLIGKNSLEEALEICNQYPNNEVIQSQKIKILIIQNEFDEALEICEKFPNNESIQSQKITILTELNRLDEALEICNKYLNDEIFQHQRNEIIKQKDEKELNSEKRESLKISNLIKQNKFEEALKLCGKFPNYESIQSHKITILMKQDKLEEALEICNQYPNNEVIQSQKITILLEQNKLEEALEICNKFPDFEQIQSKKIAILLQQNKLNEALDICNNFLNNEIIQSQKSKILVMQNEFAKALEICDQFPNSEVIQSQKVKILLQQNKLNEALEICDRFPKVLSIQSQKITILLQQNKLNEALKICNEFSDYEPIQSQKVTILEKLNRIDEALEICEKYLNNEIIQSQKNNIVKKRKFFEPFKQIENNEDNNKKNIILTKLYCNYIKLEEIENSSLDEWEKLLLTIAYYEKFNKQKGINLIKQYKKNNVIDSEQSKTLNILLDRLNNKKNVFFDYTIYTKYLNCNIIDDLVVKLEKEKNKQVDTNIQQKEKVNDIEVTEQSSSPNDERQLKQVKQMIVIEGKRVNSRNLFNVHEKEQLQIKPIDNILIKDIFKDEVLEIGKYLYVQMRDIKTQAIAIQAWDRFQVLVNKPISDKDALNRMISFLKRIEGSPSVQINLNEKKYTKYIQQ